MAARVERCQPSTSASQHRPLASLSPFCLRALRTACMHPLGAMHAAVHGHSVLEVEPLTRAVLADHRLWAASAAPGCAPGGPAVWSLLLPGQAGQLAARRSMTYLVSAAQAAASSGAIMLHVRSSSCPAGTRRHGAC